MDLDSNSSMNRLAMSGILGEPMAVPWTCSEYLHLEEEVGIFEAELQQCNYVLEVHQNPIKK